MKASIYKEAGKIWKNIAREANGQQLNETDVHRMIRGTFHIGPFYYYIFNIKEVSFEYISPGISDMLGYSGKITVPELIQKIHPDDQPWFLNFETKVGEFFATLTTEQIPHYKVSYDYRIKKSNGDYIRILQQVITLNFEPDGRLLRSLGVHTDISHIKSPDADGAHPTMSLIGLSGQPSYYNIDVKEVFRTSDTMITEREREVLCFLANGWTSELIGREMNISKQTVDTHRKNLLDKTGTRNTAGLISKAIRSGWI